MDPRAGLHVLGKRKMSSAEIRTPDRPARSIVTVLAVRQLLLCRACDAVCADALLSFEKKRKRDEGNGTSAVRVG